VNLVIITLSVIKEIKKILATDELYDEHRRRLINLLTESCTGLPQNMRYIVAVKREQDAAVDCCDNLTEAIRCIAVGYLAFWGDSGLLNASDTIYLCPDNGWSIVRRDVASNHMRLE